MSKSRITKKRTNKKTRKSQTHRKNKKYSLKNRKSIKGGYGPSNFSELSPKHYYPLNDYVNDPNNPTIMQSERLSIPAQHGGFCESCSSKFRSKTRKL